MMKDGNIKIIDYKQEYASQFDALDYAYWGKNEIEVPSSEIDDKSIVKLAIKDEKVVGLLHFKMIGDLIDVYHILVNDKFYHQGIATALMKEGLKEIDKQNIKTLIAHAVEHDGKINAEKLLKQFDFHEIYRVKEYWNALYPGEYCKQCGNNHCRCGVVVYIKQMN